MYATDVAFRNQPSGAARRGTLVEDRWRRAEQ
jgi:hypothetical protein